MPHGYASGNEPSPSNALKLGYQEDGIGDLWLTVANTEWGRIPGKGKDSTCWYSYNGVEYVTDDFYWVTFPNTVITIPNDGSDPPSSARPIGYQNDGHGDIYGAIANTEWGKIPGKALGNTCWYPYGGEEHETEDFDWLASSRIDGPDGITSMDVDYVVGGKPPANGLDFGYQNDGAGKLWIAVAETKWGKIPGKAKDNTCWYSYGGTEYNTDEFQWVVYTSPHTLIKNEGDGPPLNAAAVGNQTDGIGELYAAIALTEWGRIPGKAVGNTCWFPYGEKEHETTDFEWVVIAD